MAVFIKRQIKGIQLLSAIVMLYGCFPSFAPEVMVKREIRKDDVTNHNPRNGFGLYNNYRYNVDEGINTLSNNEVVYYTGTLVLEDGTRSRMLFDGGYLR